MSDQHSMVPSVLGGMNLPVQAGSDKELDALSKGGDYLPRVQLMDKGSGPVVENKIQQGRYALITSKDSPVVDLTNSFDALVLCRRAHAIRMGQQGLLSFYEPSDPEFKKVVVDSETRDSGCFWGPEYLIWVRPIRTWATVLCGSKTARRSSADINTILKEYAENQVDPFATFKCSLKTKSTYKWWGMDIIPCSTPFTEVPDQAEMAEQVTKFLNPPKSSVKTVSAGPSRAM